MAWVLLTLKELTLKALQEFCLVQSVEDRKASAEAEGAAWNTAVAGREKDRSIGG